jgi:hypothetical protein
MSVFFNHAAHKAATRESRWFDMLLQAALFLDEQ